MPSYVKSPFRRNQLNSAQYVRAQSSELVLELVELLVLELVELLVLEVEELVELEVEELELSSALSCLAAIEKEINVAAGVFVGTD